MNRILLLSIAGVVFRRIGVSDRVSAANWAGEHLPPA